MDQPDRREGAGHPDPPPPPEAPPSKPAQPAKGALWLDSPPRLILLLLASNLAVEATIMAVLHFGTRAPGWPAVLGDCLTDTLFLTPALYFFVFRPFRRKVEAQAAIEAELREVNRHLGEEVAERRRAQAELTLQRNKLDSILERMEDGVCVLDSSYRFLYVNPHLRERFGEPERRRCYQYFHQRSLPCDGCLRGRVLAGETVRWEFASPGGERWFEATARPLELPDGSTGLLEFVHDMTDRRRHEEAIVESRDFYLKLLDDLPNPVWRSDAAGRCDYVNKAWVEFTGCPGPEALGKVWSPGVHPDDVRACREAFARASGRREPFELEFRLRHRSGEYRWLQAFGTPFHDLGGRFVGYVAACYDVTRQRLEKEGLRSSREQLRKLSARVEAAREDERKRIAREIHDDLGQTLTALKLDVAWVSLNLGKRGARGRVLGKIDAMIRDVDEAIGSVQRICRELRPALLDDLGLVAACDWQVREFAEKAGIACALAAPSEDVRCSAQAATALFRVLQEALTNVARHAGARRVEVTLEALDGSLTLMVRDDGRGVTPEEATAPESLGLLGIRERAARLGGEALIEAGSQAGTTVRFTIPNVGESDARTGP